MAIPTNGLVFYAPLAEDKATAETGQTLTKTGTITQAKIDGIPCSYFNGNSYIRVDLSTMPYGTDDFAFSLWARCDGESGIVLQLGSWTTGARLSQLDDGLLQAWLRGTVDLRTTEAYDRMVHVAVTRNSGTSSLYINGSLVATSQESAELSQYTQISLMNSYTNGPRYVTGYLAAVRLYNRGLSADEITELANEFSGIDDGTGVVIDGLFLSNSRPKAGDKGLLVNNKFFIPFAESSEGGSGGGTSAEYYKCASVDTEAKTWSGYKAVFDSTAGTWSFSDTVTEGLSYIGITPVVGKIYSADTTIQVGYIKLDGILNDETVKFLLYPKLNGTLEDVSAGGNGVTVTNTGSVAVENNRIVFGEGKALIIPANTLPNDIFVSGSPFLIEFQGIIPAYTSKICCPWARKSGSMYYDRFDMYLVTVEGDSNYGKISIPNLDENAPLGVFTVGAEHVVAVEYDGNNTGRVYLDGVLQYSFTGTRYLPFRTFDFYIGHDEDEIGGSNANPFQGSMSYFRIRNVAPYQGANYTPEWV